VFHEPAAQGGKDPAAPFKSRLGVIMFVVYALVYAGFVAINLTSPGAMETETILGLNLAVFYGFFLIVFALVLALIYTLICSAKEAELAKADTNGKGA